MISDRIGYCQMFFTIRLQKPKNMMSGETNKLLYFVYVYDVKSCKTKQSPFIFRNISYFQINKEAH